MKFPYSQLCETIKRAGPQTVKSLTLTPELVKEFNRRGIFAEAVKINGGISGVYLAYDPLTSKEQKLATSPRHRWVIAIEYHFSWPAVRDNNVLPFSALLMSLDCLWEQGLYKQLKCLDAHMSAEIKEEQGTRELWYLTTEETAEKVELTLEKLRQEYKTILETNKLCKDYELTQVFINKRSHAEDLFTSAASTE